MAVRAFVLTVALPRHRCLAKRSSYTVKPKAKNMAHAQLWMTVYQTVLHIKVFGTKRDTKFCLTNV